MTPKSSYSVSIDDECQESPTCYHCGQPCNEILWQKDRPFCCAGCQTVFNLLDSNNLCEYYTLENNPGNHIEVVSPGTYAYLDEKDVRKKILSFDSGNFARVNFFIPAMHCISCIWLLENIQKLQKGILRSRVNFARKTIEIEFNPEYVKLGAIADALSSVGYGPRINLDSEKPPKLPVDGNLILKLAIAGFCFGNVMLFSFPEYLGLDHSDQYLMRIFSWLNFTLSIPVFFYSGADYIRNAWRSFKEKQINIDVPIAAGLIALFLRSTYDIVSATGPGYFDSFTGLVFFLLIGRWFQSRTYESLAFDRDFSSYFPLAVNRWTLEEWRPVVIYELKKCDKIRIRNMEIVPADSILIDEQAYIDYGFVTGEARPVKVMKGDLVYAGGRLIGTAITLVVEKSTSQSHLTSLWNNDAFKKTTESKYKKVIDSAARKFTWVVILIASCTFVYWSLYDPSQKWLVLTSVLMVACPCALALAAPFTYGSVLRVFGKNKLYLKNADIVEKLADIDAVVFDKTGTITHGDTPDVSFEGSLNSLELSRIKTLTSYSTHPLSIIISKSITLSSPESVTEFKELPGQGIEGIINRRYIKVGSASFVGCKIQSSPSSATVYVRIDDRLVGRFIVKNAIRTNLGAMLKKLGRRKLSLLSGDNESEKALMKSIFHSTANLFFNQSPHDKMAYVENLQKQGSKVLMVGDGLNDAGALQKSDVGLAVSDNTGIFSPACDGILLGEKLHKLDKYLELAKASSVILKIAFGLSFFYNAIALSFAVTGNLTPLVAAILMPISSISVVSFSSIAVNFVANRKIGT